MRISTQEFRQHPLRVHSFLREEWLEDAWAIPLEGGGVGRTIEDVSQAFAERTDAMPPIVNFLFALRGQMGAWFGWDRKQPEWKSESFTQYLTPTDRAHSTVAPGSPDGRFSFLYRFECEQLSEVRNATVHAFASMSLEPTQDGYQMILAVYVKPVNGLTRLYMELIKPFRRYIVYPALIRSTQTAWVKRFGQVL